MLLTILGWFWTIIGINFLLKPERLRNKLKTQSVEKLKKFFFWLSLVIGILLVKAAWGIPGFWAKIVVLFGFLSIAKAFFILKAKAADAAIQWYINKPVKFFRISAAVLIIIGAVILTA